MYNEQIHSIHYNKLLQKLFTAYYLFYILFNLQKYFFAWYVLNKYLFMHSIFTAAHHYINLKSSSVIKRDTNFWSDILWMECHESLGLFLLQNIIKQRKHFNTPIIILVLCSYKILYIVMQFKKLSQPSISFIKIN